MSAPQREDWPSDRALAVPAHWLAGVPLAAGASRAAIAVVAIEELVAADRVVGWHVACGTRGMFRSSSETVVTPSAALLDGSEAVDGVEVAERLAIPSFGCGDVGARARVDLHGYSISTVLEALLADGGAPPPIPLSTLLDEHAGAAAWPERSSAVADALATSLEIGQRLHRAYNPAAVLLFGFPTYCLRSFCEPLARARHIELTEVPAFIRSYQAWARRWPRTLVDAGHSASRERWEQIDESLHGVRLDAARFGPELANWPCAQCVPIKDALGLAGHAHLIDFNGPCARCTATRLKLRTIFTGFQDFDFLLVTDAADAARDDLLIRWREVMAPLRRYDREPASLLTSGAALGDVFFVTEASFHDALGAYEPARRAQLDLPVLNTWLPAGSSVIDIEACLPSSALLLDGVEVIARSLRRVRTALARSAAPDATLARLMRRGTYNHDLYADEQVRAVSIERLRSWAADRPVAS